MPICTRKGFLMKQNIAPPKASLLRILLAVILLAAAGIYTRYWDSHDAFSVSVVPPTCEENGYSLYTNQRTGSTDVRDITAAAGHRYGSWTTLTAPSPEPTRRLRTCTVCSSEETDLQYPELPIPSVILTGDVSGIGKTTEVSVTCTGLGWETSIDGFATLKLQGHSTLAYDKTNFTLKLYRDSDRTEKHKLQLLHWAPEHRYILKANYTDPSQCRNLVCADIWGDMVALRDRVPDLLTGLANGGAVDGFPVALYINGSFRGLYTWNLHKDEDLFDMKDGSPQAMMIVNHTDRDEAFFRSDAAFREDTPWEVEYCGTEDDAWARQHLQDLLRFVQTADDARFRAELHTLLDIDSAVDYLIAMYALGLTEHAAKDLLLVCDGPDAPWICSLYDMEEAFDPAALPTVTDGAWDSGTGSLLWDRFLNAFYPELCQRYVKLRQTVLDPDALCSRVETFLRAIPTALYQADAAVNGTAEHTPRETETILQDIRSRISAADKIFSKVGN